MDIERIRKIEEYAYNSWPAKVVSVFDGWRLRWTNDITRRGNSVLATVMHNDIPLVEKLERVEFFYSQYNSPPQFQISPAVLPQDLDEVLAARGYLAEFFTNVKIAKLEKVLEKTHKTMANFVQVNDQHTSEWLYAYSGNDLQSKDAITRAGIFERITQPKAFLLLPLEVKTAGIGLGVLEDTWVGIFCMLTVEYFRRHGVATAILHALARWGSEKGAKYMYLQVMKDNMPALNLYTRAGFETLYSYHYRRKTN
jgi:ribosomal protein S18 acetylase RimI-like enzyme